MAEVTKINGYDIKDDVSGYNAYPSYASGYQLSYDTEYTATADGVLVINQTTQQSTLTINGVSMGISGAKWHTYNTFPVAKGTTILISKVSGANALLAYVHY